MEPIAFLLLTRLREHELKVEDLERKIKTLEKENESLENKLETMTEKFNAAKAELDETLKAMEDM
jgi:tropomyosin